MPSKKELEAMYWNTTKRSDERSKAVEWFKTTYPDAGEEVIELFVKEFDSSETKDIDKRRMEAALKVITTK